MLGIGAVIGAGIFSAIGTAAVGEVAADGTVVRYGAGPALVLSFVLLGAVCALAGLCYAELTAMIPISGSAYTYAYATLGELVAWIIGWDLILEYAVGNVAVAIAWSGYFASLLRFFGIDFPFWLAHSYRDVAALLPRAPGASCPLVLGHPVAINLPGIVIVALITWLLVIGVTRERPGQQRDGRPEARGARALRRRRASSTSTRRTGRPSPPTAGAGSTRARRSCSSPTSASTRSRPRPRRRRTRSATCRIGILGSLAICTVIYVVVGLVATGLVPYQQLKGADPLAARLRGGRASAGARPIISFGADRLDDRGAARVPAGQPRIFFSMSRDGLLPPVVPRASTRRYRTPHVTTIVTGVVVALGSTILDDDETYDLTNIGTLFAFLVVCLGRARAAAQGARPPAALPRALRVARGAARGRRPAST